MWDFTYQKLEQLATWQNFGILFVLLIFCCLHFLWRQEALGEKVKTFDAHKWGYNPDQAYVVLDKMGERGRRIYIFTQLTLDVIFPFVYGGLIIILLFKLYGSPKYLLLIPVIMVTADLLENITTSYLAWSFSKGVPASIVRIAAFFTVVKWIGIFLSLAILLIGLLVIAYQWLKKFI